MRHKKPQSPTDLTKRSWLYVLRKTGREFGKDQCTDLAAALTYYAVLAVFPAMLALLALLGLVGQGPRTVQSLLDVIRDLGGGTAADFLEPTLSSLSQASNTAGFAFAAGLAAALWSASAYVAAFGRALNRMYGVAEGRPFWKLRPLQILVTLVSLILVALIATALVLTGPAARAVGEAMNLEATAVQVWDLAKWPVVVLAAVLVIAILYYATPNVQQPKLRWLSPGAFLAIVVWALASAAFGFYVSNFGSYNKTYGTLAGVVIFLLWLWITNLALLFGAELDCELERGRELQAGMAAEEQILLPPRDTRNTIKAARKEQEDIRRGRALRQARGADVPAHASPSEARPQSGSAQANPSGPSDSKEQIHAP